jgi:hypothetical protein
MPRAKGVRVTPAVLCPGAALAAESVLAPPFSQRVGRKFRLTCGPDSRVDAPGRSQLSAVQIGFEIAIFLATL